MKLFHSPTSPYVRKVMACAYELDIAERIEKVYSLVSMTQVNPDVIKINPVARIPALVPIISQLDLPAFVTGHAEEDQRIATLRPLHPPPLPIHAEAVNAVLPFDDSLRIPTTAGRRIDQRRASARRLRIDPGAVRRPVEVR